MAAFFRKCQPGDGFVMETRRVGIKAVHILERAFDSAGCIIHPCLLPTS